MRLQQDISQKLAEGRRKFQPYGAKDVEILSLWVASFRKIKKGKRIEQDQKALNSLRLAESMSVYHFAKFGAKQFPTVTSQWSPCRIFSPQVESPGAREEGEGIQGIAWA